MTDGTRLDDRPPISPWLVTTWLGLLGGMLELTVILTLYAYKPTVTAESIRVNRHYLWMIPLGNLIIGFAIGRLLTPLMGGKNQTLRRAGTLLSAIVFAYPPIAAFGSLHRISQVLLVAGISFQTARVIRTRPRLVASLIRYTFPAFLLLNLALGLFSYYKVELAEARAIANLPSARRNAPNVLLLVMDNVRADSLSTYGYSRETSPNLTKLAERGVLFEDVRSPAPWTLPSHASIMTGRWPHQLSSSVDSPLDDTHPTLAKILSAGYATAGYVGNTFYCNAWFGLDRGFASYEDFPQNREINLLEIVRNSGLGRDLAKLAKIPTEVPGDTRWRKSAAAINRSALSWIDTHKERPFFVFLNYYDAHEPFEPPIGDRRQFGLSRLPSPERQTIINDYQRVLSGKIAADSVDGAAIVERAANLLSDSYDDCIHSLDGQIGNLVDELERRSLLDNTMIVITSDHGEHFGDRGLFGHGHSLYSPVIDIPLLIMNPLGRGAGLRVKSPVSSRDIANTIVNELMINPAEPLQGRSLASHWDPSKQNSVAEPSSPLSHVEHQRTFADSPHIPASLGPIWSVADSKFVFILNSDGREELYHRVDDPKESVNLIQRPDFSDHGKRLRDSLLRQAENME